MNDGPTAVDDAYTTNEDLVLDATVAGAAVSPADNDTDPENNTLTITAVSNPTGGTVSLVSGTITFDPAQDVCEPGSYGFDNTVSDGTATDTGHTDVTITCVADPSTIVYQGETMDETNNGSTSLSAKVTSGDSACTTSRAVEFWVDLDGDMVFESPDNGSGQNEKVATVNTNASGVATTTYVLTPGVYLLEVVAPATSACGASTDYASVTVVGPGNTATGGGHYFWDGSGQTGSDRINFGFTIQRTKDGASKGQILWMNNGRNRIKGTLNSYGVFPCPGTELIKCGSASGTEVMQEWSGTDWVASTYGTVTFTITFYDGGSARKGGALKPDYFGTQSVEGQLRAASLRAASLRAASWGRPRDDGHHVSFDGQRISAGRAYLARQSPTDSYGRREARRTVPDACRGLVWWRSVRGPHPRVDAERGREPRAGTDRPYESGGAWAAGHAGHADRAEMRRPQVVEWR